MSGNTESLTLKWGTLKGWNLNEDGEAFKLLKRYNEDPTSFSAMAQHDTDHQKAMILEMIDVIDCDQIYLDWDGKYVSKEEAKEYITNYGKS